MKSRYQRLTKNERLQIKKEYFNTEIGKSQKNRFIKLYIYGIMGILISAFLVYENITKDNNVFWEYSIAGLLFVCSIIFIIGSCIIKNKSINNYLLNKIKKQ